MDIPVIIFLCESVYMAHMQFGLCYLVNKVRNWSLILASPIMFTNLPFFVFILIFMPSSSEIKASFGAVLPITNMIG